MVNTKQQKSAFLTTMQLVHNATNLTF